MTEPRLIHKKGGTQKMPFSNWSKRTKVMIGVASVIVLIAIVVVLVGTQTGLFGTASTEPPFGSFDTPIEGSTVRSSVPVTGWALDDVGVESVKIYRGENGGLAYIGDAVFVEGARPDVELMYPDYPNSDKAGWGYMLLTYFLPNGGNGTYTLHAIATDVEGNQVTLGTKTFTCDNANAVKPFGNIDTPAMGETVSGSTSPPFSQDTPTVTALTGFLTSIRRVTQMGCIRYT
jgi:hypothetical protein